MELYLACYWVHLTCVLLSGGFFLLRGLWMLRESGLLQHRFVRVAPHVNDTLLLLTGIGLAVITQQYPVTHNWLTLKLVLLFFYIGLGMVALRGSRKNIRVAAFVLAVTTFAAMVAVALAHR